MKKNKPSGVVPMWKSVVGFVVLASVAGSLPATASAAPNCTIKGTSKSETLRGTKKRDVICGRGGHDRIFGRGGNDIIIAGYGNDTVYGGPGNDIIKGESGRDTLVGEGGRDVLQGQTGNDTLNGGSGNDTLIGGSGVDNCLARSETERDADGNAVCDRWGYRLSAPLISYSQGFRRIYPEEAVERGFSVIAPGGNEFRHCLINNCGNVVDYYCTVRSDGYVEGCYVWNGYGNGWADLMFTALRTGDECGLPTSWGMCNLPGQWAPDRLVVRHAPGMYMGEGTWLISS